MNMEISMIGKSRRKMNRNKNLLILYHLWKKQQTAKFSMLFFNYVL